MPGAVAIMAGIGMTACVVLIGRRRLAMIAHVNLGRGMGVLGRRVAGGVGIGPDHAGHDQRKRHGGCKQPRRPCLGGAVHHTGLMDRHFANIKTAAWPQVAEY
jgi:hypothetical protein